MSATSATHPNRWKSAIAAVLIAILIAIAAVTAVGWCSLTRPAPLTQYDSPADQFKYGSIGTESVSGLPFWIWVVLPRLFPEKLPGPGGYTALGLTWEPGNEMPIGFTKETIGVPRVGMNCAACHVGTVQNTVTERPTLLLGAPSSTFDIQGYQQFLLDCAHDPLFNANFILPEITYNINLSPWEKLLYRVVLIPATRKRILAQQSHGAASAEHPVLGPGRWQMNPLKQGGLKRLEDRSTGSADTLPLWHEAAKDGVYKYSNGLTLSLHELVS